MAVAWGSGDNLVAQVGGEPIRFTIKDTRRVEGTSQFNLKKKSGENLGYHFEIVTSEGKIVKVNTWTLLFALQGINADIGDTIVLRRPQKGVYQVKKDNAVKDKPEYLKKLEEKYSVPESPKQQEEW